MMIHKIDSMCDKMSYISRLIFFLVQNWLGDKQELLET